MSLRQRLEQRLKLAPQIIQSIKILQLSALELKQLVQNELVENPVMEVAEEAEEEVVQEESEPRVEVAAEKYRKDREASLEIEGHIDKEFAKLEDILEHFEKQAVERRAYVSDRDEKQDALQNTAAKPISLQDFLFQQFALLDLPEEVKKAGESIIYNIDDNGYVMYPLEEVFETKEAAGLAVAEEALKVVQALDPPGVGARNLKEALLLQLGKSEQHSLERHIVENHLDDVSANRIPKIARELSLPLNDVNKAIELIGMLSLHPGALISGEPAHFVVPDVVVEDVEGRYEVRLENAYIPSVYISRAYEKMLTDKGANPQVRDYVRKKVESARRLIRAIEQRKSTLQRIANELVAVQQNFLKNGVSGLKPLKMQEIADRVGVHISTVCRAIADKFIQTPRGIFPMKFFFTGGAQIRDGEAESTRSIKEQVAEMIGKEDKRNPLSDEEIAAELKSRGIRFERRNKVNNVNQEIARRTVTKYRRALDIPPSRKRKIF
jgi:RNA polymerase sigma-54 factor